MNILYAALGIVIFFLIAVPFWDKIIPPLGVKEDRVEKEYITESPVTIVEFLDFQCAFCKQSHPIIREIQQQYKDKLLYIPKYFPSPSNLLSQKAAVAAVCAEYQGKGGAYQDALFESLTEMRIIEIAKELQLDLLAFTSCLESQEAIGRVEADIKEGISHGISGTPTFYINGVRVEGIPELQTWKDAIEQLIP